jgi:hypothetical protein
MQHRSFDLVQWFQMGSTNIYTAEKDWQRQSFD